MREFKFRVIKKDGMYYSESLEDMAIADNCYLLASRLENTPIMQYTGLKDKNGNEIYEGDIVLYESNIGFNGEEYDSEIGYISWINNLSKFIINWNNSDYSSIEDADIKVIGNIYENPELLEKNNND